MTKCWPIFSLIVVASFSLPVLAADVPMTDKKSRNAKSAVIKKAQMPDQSVLPAGQTDKTSSQSKSKTSNHQDTDAGVAANDGKPDSAALTPSAQKSQNVPGPGFPTTIPDAKAAAEANANPNLVPREWPATEVELARARCTQLLKTIDAVSVPEAPFREGECGTPAPIRLISIGKNPEVAISPPAILTCDMAFALYAWLKSDLQPLARKHLGSDIIKIESMSDYSCRNAYGRAKNKLSEHGRANALDIRGFVLANALSAMVLDSWGATERDIAKRIAAAKSAQDKLDKQGAAKVTAPTTVVTSETGKSSGPTGAPSTTTVDTAIRATILDGVSGGTSSASRTPDLSLDQPSHVGGPKDGETSNTGKTGENPEAKVANASKTSTNSKAKSVDSEAGSQNAAITTGTGNFDKKMHFMREAHAAGCRIFGTTLGPEANEAHRNHLHVDMAPRKTTKICE